MASKQNRFLTTSVDGMIQRLALILAFIASGILGFLVYMTAKASVPASVNGAAGGWVILMFLPIWLVLCLFAARCGYKLGGKYRLLAWFPLLSGLLASLVINNLF